MARFRWPARGAWLSGTGPFALLGVAFAVVSVGFLVAALQPPSGLEWTGNAMKGSERDGIVYYSVHGKTYAADDVGSFRTGTATVYIDPHDPNVAIVDKPASRYIDMATVLGPGALAVACGVMGFRRKRSRRRAQLAVATLPREALAGQGIDDQTMQELRDRQHERPPVTEDQRWWRNHHVGEGA
jgi:hypothetical protein